MYVYIYPCAHIDIKESCLLGIQAFLVIVLTAVVGFSFCKAL